MFLLTTAALAGDPCPIDVVLTEATPEWRDRSADLAKLNTQKSLYGFTWKDDGAIAVITALVPGTQAADHLRVGDRVLAVAGAPLVADGQFAIAIDAADGGALPLRFDRNGTRDEVTLKPAPVDPLAWRLFGRLQKTECRTPSRATLSDVQRADLHRAAFDANKGFRCTDAHQRFQERYADGTMVLLRGGKRVMLTMPGWSTVCLTVAETDTTPADSLVDSWLQRATESYVKDRHANP